MQSLSRATTATASGVEILFVIGCVVLNGAGGAFTGAVVGAGRQMQYGGSDASGSAVLGFLIGAVVGFVVSSLIVSMSMNLREIALNTRQLVELYGGAGSVTGSVAEPEARVESAVQRRDDPKYSPFANPTTDLSEPAKIALNRAKQEGYTLRIDASGRVIIMARGKEGEFYFTCNGDIEDLAREKGWL